MISDPESLMNETIAGNSTNNTIQGWVSSPNERGTLDIVWSCALTIFLCCWTSVYPNIPAIGDGQWDRFRDKFELAALGMLGPEFLFALALGQWQSARRSVNKFKRFKTAERSEWTIKHAFFADMGGFFLKAPNFPAFPIDADQLYYLISKGYVEYPEIAKDVLSEKNKVDGLSRAITLIQGLWFTITSVARVIQHLEITTLELTTLSFIFCMLVTSYCWRHKPGDVERPIILKTNTSIADILIKAGDAARIPYRRTPLDFVNREEWCISLLWAYYVQILRSMNLSFCSRTIKGRPLNRMPSINWPPLTLSATLWYGLVTLIYSSIFLLAWNLQFPTATEKLLWHIAAIVTIAFPVAVWPFECYIDRNHSVRNQPPRRKDSKDHDCEALPQYPYLSKRHSGPKPTKGFAGKLRNNSPDKDPQMGVELRALIPATILCAAYTLARVYFLTEDLIGLRSLPPSVFRTVEWMDLIPHI
ncbi:hypothetical protein FQN54_006977 [Arachnomyces sp. PD_36]|nr:hypothetical protein FQN54_006977 [Arachnomyces sp. PD_36]